MMTEKQKQTRATLGQTPMYTTTDQAFVKEWGGPMAPEPPISPRWTNAVAAVKAADHEAAQAAVDEATRLEAHANRCQGGAIDTVGYGIWGETKTLLALARTFFAKATATDYSPEQAETAQTAYATALAKVKPMAEEMTPLFE